MSQEEWIAKHLATAPPITKEQRETIARLLAWPDSRSVVAPTQESNHPADRSHWSATRTTRVLRRGVAERVEQVVIGGGENELGAALTSVLDLVDVAEAAGRGSVSTAALRAAIGAGLDLD